jgi:hypothetical protein
MVAAPPPPATTVPARPEWFGRILAAVRALLGRLLVWLRLLPPPRVLPVAPWCPLAEIITGRATRDFHPPHEVYLYFSYMTSPFYAVTPAPPRDLSRVVNARAFDGEGDNKGGGNARAVSAGAVNAQIPVGRRAPDLGGERTPVQWMRSRGDVEHEVDRGRDRARFE